MANLKGSKTEKNILTAFAGESQARNRYTFFASQAKKDGFVQISTIFEEIANQEKEHAKRLFKLLEGGEVEITGSFPPIATGVTNPLSIWSYSSYRLVNFRASCFTSTMTFQALTLSKSPSIQSAPFQTSAL